jgi:hypothetical protein
VDGPRLLMVNGQEAATITVESVEENGAVALSTVTLIRHEGGRCSSRRRYRRLRPEQYQEGLDAVTWLGAAAPGRRAGG